MVQDRLMHAVHALSKAILNPFDVDDLLNQVMGHTTVTLQAEAAGIMLVNRDGHLGYAAASNDLVSSIERLQDREQTGACYAAFKADEVIAIGELRTEERWPAYTARALELGLRSVLGVPLCAYGQNIGVLNIYRADPGEWSDQEIIAGEVLGALGAAYIVNASQRQAQHDLTETLHKALESRGAIEQAKGVLMAEKDVDADTAFKLLRQAATDRNCKLREVAQETIAEAESR